MKLYIYPSFDRPDEADGGIRRVVEAQRAYLPKHGVEIVDNTEEADIVAVHAGAWIETRKPMVAHCHGLYWSEYEWENWALALNRDVIRVLHRADAITAPSEWVANAVRRAMWCDVAVLHHGIDTAKWMPLKTGREDYVLWNKTRVDSVCDPQPLNELVRMMPNQRFVSTYFNEDAAENLTVTGPLPHDAAKQLVERAGIYLCTTRETFGIGTIEAMACGVPVVGWAWGGQQEIVTHGVDGFLARPGDVAGLKEGIVYVREHYQEMSRAARKTALEHFKWETAIARYVDVYESVLLEAEANKKRPTVSVIIPCYKLEEYLPDAIESVVTQAGDVTTEIVVVDDNSPTWTDKVLENFKTRGTVKVIHNEKNLYLAGALNEGIRQSTGRYIVPLDADNMLAPGTLATLAGELDKHPTLDIAYGAVKFVLPDGTPDRSVSSDGVSEWPFDQFSYSQQMQNMNQIPSTSMYRRKWWERSGGYRRRWRTAEDADFWCRVTSIGAYPAKVTDAVTLIYRQREDSMSRVETKRDWCAWYPWSQKPELTPFAAPRDDTQNPSVLTYDPAIITVIIPVGAGHGQIVVDAVDSIIAQTFQKWRIIVVNDSGENIADLPVYVDRYATDRPGSGPAVARNIGLAQVKSPYFLLLDADDILSPTALEDMLDAITIYGGYVYSDWMVHESGEVHEAPDFDAEELKQSLFHAVTCLYPTKAYHEVGGFDELLRGWEDWDYILTLCAAGYCGTHVHKPLLQYRMATGTVREGLLANKDEHLANMRKKWSDEKLAGCGSCGGGGAQSYIQYEQQSSTPLGASQQRAVNGADTSDLVLVEFIPDGEGTRVFVGPTTGREYRFGSVDPDDKVRYVHKADLDHFLRLRDFRLFTGDNVSVDGDLVQAAGAATGVTNA